MPSTLRYSSPQSSFNPSFWEALYHRKLNLYKLSDESVEIRAKFTIGSDVENGSFYFSEKSFTGDFDLLLAFGKMLNLNSVEEFTEYDKKKELETLSSKLFQSIVSGEAIKNPWLLTEFFLLTFADLKSYKFLYWFCLPAVVPPNPFQFEYAGLLGQYQDLGNSKILNVIYSHFQENTFSRSVHLFAVLDFPGVECPQVVSLSEAWSHRFEQYCHFIIVDQSYTSESLGWISRNFLMLALLYSGAAPSCQSLVGQEKITIRSGKIRLIGIRNSLLRKENFLNSPLEDLSKFSLSIVWRLLTSPPLSARRSKRPRRSYFGA